MANQQKTVYNASGVDFTIYSTTKPSSAGPKTYWLLEDYSTGKRPSYYVMQLYSRHAQPVPLRIDQARDGPDVFACGSADGKSVVVFAVNAKTEPVAWSYQF